MKLRAALRSLRGGLLLVPWALAAGFTLTRGPFGLTEEGAKALLLAWSIADQVPSAAFTLGTPDIRLIAFLPLGFVWPGQVIAAKLMTLLVMALAGAALYHWRARDDQAEAALLATGLLLIAPLTVQSINALSPAPFLLAIAGAASWLDRKLGTERAAFGGWFFAQLLLCAAAVTLHPAGLAYPVILFFRWWKDTPEQRHRDHFLLGIPLAIVLVLAMRLGWPGIGWGQNPLAAAAAVWSGPWAEGPLGGSSTLGAAVLLATALAVAIHERRRLLTDLTGGTLLLSALVGVVAADRTWGLLMFAVVLYGGLPWLLRACAPLAGRGFLFERGWLWLLLLLICTAFMRVDRSDVEWGREQRLTADDQLISDFAQGISTAPASTPVLVASSWPARTSIACRCGALPLPPATKDPASQIVIMRGVSYLILGDALENRALAANFAQLGSQVEVVSKEPGGVVLRFKPPKAEL
jgi:hypothetical protein